MLDLIDLRADCGRCTGLCCVAPAFARSADFAFAKPAGTPCRHLRPDARCGVHAELRPRGMVGCTVFDCFGAGQALSARADWRTGDRDAVFAAFPQLRTLHELLRYLVEARELGQGALAEDLGAAVARTSELAELEPVELATLDVEAHRRAVNPLLVAASEAARGDGPDHRGADLIGARLRGTDLRRASLRGALLLGADLRGADLRGADVTGADFRGARLEGADLRGVLFLVPPQLTAAQGDTTTRLPAGFERPAHWTSPAPVRPRGPGRRRARQR
ncbi:pentapeptide repeat-containing protein [Pseudonocardia halophobica]|uniref:Pentapeptide repeat-containing protein n=1 Tax=Pseudonocardia halophobica TaxID=29401 RepID=A0A9W6KYP8_9PSEU|nr:pentapeptide repeat-containing protein [Pseudonocardia halophobica]GLL08991.1 hypothetical protein GCM10017577_01310 [Pseudonocardia halophobica]